MKTMAQNAGLTGRLMNHSARKTMITRLVQSNVHPLHVAQLSGHKNLKSLDSYAVASLQQQKDMSALISGTSSSTNTSNVQISKTTSTVSNGLTGITINGNVVNVYVNPQ